MTIDREPLIALAYGMVGSRASAEDLVQEALLRLTQVADVNEPAAWLRTVVTRLALDELKSARVRRETYVGPWLPEMLVTEPADPVLRQEALCLATLVVLERLSPAERCAFLLREMFDLDYEAIGQLLERSGPATRKLVSRSRQRLADERVRYEPAREAHRQLLGVLYTAVSTGDLQALEQLLAEDARFVSDGGGKAIAALRPVLGRSKVARLLIGLARDLGPTTQLTFTELNGHLGMLIRDGGELTSALVFCIEAGQTTAIYSLRNPDKLAHLPAPTGG